ncbi:MAG: hypothetical protein ACREQA_09980, partial [Candidatus Binatia bacterium]
MLVAFSDIHGLIYDPDGIDFTALVRAKKEGGMILACGGGGRRLAKEEIFSLPCDIFIPAARPDTLHKENAPLLQTRLVLQGANIPATPEAERILFERLLERLVHDKLLPREAAMH